MINNPPNLKNGLYYEYKDLSSFRSRMKSFWERFSVTKLVLLLLVLALMFIEIWNVLQGGDISQLFSNVVIAVISFYFGQKGIQYEDVDSIVEKADLDTKDKV